MFVLIFYTHRENVKRLKNKEENMKKNNTLLNDIKDKHDKLKEIYDNKKNEHKILNIKIHKILDDFKIKNENIKT